MNCSYVGAHTHSPYICGDFGKFGTPAKANSFNQAQTAGRSYEAAAPKFGAVSESARNFINATSPLFAGSSMNTQAKTSNSVGWVPFAGATKQTSSRGLNVIA